MLLRDQRRASVRSRRVGLGILGMADCFAALNLVYGSGPSLSVLDRLMGAIKETAYEESIRLAGEILQREIGAEDDLRLTSLSVEELGRTGV